MIITKKFVFLHIPRTGGMWVNETLQNQKIHTTRCHEVRSDIPHEYRKLPVVSIKRDPLSWWVSWFAKMTQDRNFIYCRYFSLLSNEREDFDKYVKEVWENLFFINRSPIPHLRDLHRNYGPWKAYQRACSPDIWIPFDNLDVKWKEFCESGGIEIIDRPACNQANNKPKLSQSSKIFIESMEK